MGQMEAGVTDSLYCHGTMCDHCSCSSEQSGLPQWVHQCGAKSTGNLSSLLEICHTLV